MQGVKGFPQLSAYAHMGKFGETLHTLHRDPSTTLDVSPYDALMRALDDLAEVRRRTPCADPEDWRKWTSEIPADRQDAATRCQPCPVLDSCAAAADELASTYGRGLFGVWAGQDRGARPRASHAGREATV